MKSQLESLISRMHEGGILYVEAVREFRKAFIATVLRENNGNQSKAARELGMHRNTLSRTASALKLDVWALRPGSRRLPRSERLVAVRRGSLVEPSPRHAS
jgi:Fis family transcriptional regulator